MISYRGAVFGEMDTDAILARHPAIYAVDDFAHRNQITQIYLGRPGKRPRVPWFSRNLIQRIVSLARDMQVVIVSERDSVPAS